MNDPIIFDEPQLGDVVVFTGELLPELEQPTVYILIEIAEGQPDPYRFASVIQPITYFASPRDVLSGVSVIRGTTRGVY